MRVVSKFSVTESSSVMGSLLYSNVKGHLLGRSREKFCSNWPKGLDEVTHVSQKPLVLSPLGHICD
jgi:hypothetical protein